MMALIRTFFLLFAAALAALGARAAEVEYPPGSRIGLVPPAGMTRSANFFGFEDAGSGASILLIALPAEAYAELDRTASADVLKQQGMRLERREALSIPLGKAFLIIGQQEFEQKKVRKRVLVSASPSLTAMVTVQVPDNAKTAYPEAAI